MSLVNYHTHCSYCDGKGEAREYAEAAVAKGFTALGFSSHAPSPFFSDWVMQEKNLPLYLAEIQRLKNQYEGRLQIYLGLEIDFVPGESSPAKFSELVLDYTIGSIHYTPGAISDLYLTVDGDDLEFSENLEKNFSGDGRKLLPPTTLT